MTFSTNSHGSVHCAKTLRLLRLCQSLRLNKFKRHHRRRLLDSAQAWGWATLVAPLAHICRLNKPVCYPPHSSRTLDLVDHLRLCPRIRVCFSHSSRPRLASTVSYLPDRRVTPRHSRTLHLLSRTRSSLQALHLLTRHPHSYRPSLQVSSHLWGTSSHLYLLNPRDSRECNLWLRASLGCSNSP